MLHRADGPPVRRLQRAVLCAVLRNSPHVQSCAQPTRTVAQQFAADERIAEIGGARNGNVQTAHGSGHRSSVRNVLGDGVRGMRSGAP